MNRAHGALMTPRQAACAPGRVTSAWRLSPTDANLTRRLLDFCTLCQKCAAGCPARHSRGPRQAIEGVLAWRSTPKAATLLVHGGARLRALHDRLPYSHPDNHNQTWCARHRTFLPFAGRE